MLQAMTDRKHGYHYNQAEDDQEALYRAEEAIRLAEEVMNQQQPPRESIAKWLFCDPNKPRQCVFLMPNNTIVDVEGDRLAGWAWRFTADAGEHLVICPDGSAHYTAIGSITSVVFNDQTFCCFCLIESDDRGTQLALLSLKREIAASVGDKRTCRVPLHDPRQQKRRCG